MTDNNDNATPDERDESSEESSVAERIREDDERDGEESSGEPSEAVEPPPKEGPSAEAGDSRKDGDHAEKGGKRSRPSTRWLRGGIPFVLGGFTQFSLCAIDKQFRWGVPLGILATFVCVWGLLDLLGTFDDPDESVAHRVKFADVWPMLAAGAGTLLLTLSLIGLAVAGQMPVVVSAFLIPASFLGLVVSVYRFGARLGAWATDETGEPRAMTRRHGFGLWWRVPFCSCPCLAAIR